MAQRAPQGIDENEIERAFLQLANGMIGQDAARTDLESLVDMFRMFHSTHGRYPTVVDLEGSDAPTLFVPVNPDTK